MNFKDKVVLVTGSSRGIGRASALAFAQGGAHVIVNYLKSKTEADSLVEVIKKEGVRSISIQCDVSNENQVKKMFETINSEFGRLDVLVNNAALVFDLPLFDKTVEQWQQTMNVNLVGAFLCSKYSVASLKKTNGVIVNVCSTSGSNSFAPTSADYDSSKVGMIALTKNLAKELSPLVRVNGVAPGWVDTDMNRDLPKEFIQDEMAKVSLHRMARPEEIANVVTFLASDFASYLSGSIIIADGGMY